MSTLDNLQHRILSLNVISPPTISKPLTLAVMPSVIKSGHKRIYKYTLSIFLERAQEIHGDKYDYSQITPEHIQNKNSKISIFCRQCCNNWYPCINNHINNKTGCPICAISQFWTLERFLMSAKLIHGDKFDYSQIISEHIKNKNSNIPIICNKCKYYWTPSINNNIYDKNGCPGCSGLIKWNLNLERFLQNAKQIHGDKFDYSQVTPQCIQNVNSKVPLTCNECKYFWTQSIQHHINQKNGCPNCNHNAPWTLERFLLAATKIHGNKFEYSQIKNNNIQGCRSKISIICTKSRHTWITTINNHIYHKSECPHCSKSRGYSDIQIEWVENIMISEGIIIQHALSP